MTAEQALPSTANDVGNGAKSKPLLRMAVAGVAAGLTGWTLAEGRWKRRLDAPWASAKDEREREGSHDE